MIHDCTFLSLDVSKEHQFNEEAVQNLQHYLESNELWYWPKKIGALKKKKIVWSSDLQWI